MPVGTVRGRYELDAPALRTLKDLERQGVRTESQMRRVGEALDGVAGKEDRERLREYEGGLADLRRTGSRTFREYRADWITTTRVVRTEVSRQRRAIRELEADLDRLGAKRVSPQINVDGITKAIGQVELLHSRLNALGRERSTPRVALGGGFGPGPGLGGSGPRAPRVMTARGGGGGPGGGGLRSVGVGPLNLGSKSGLALIGAALPAVQALLGSGTALLGSASGGLLGAGALGAAGAGGLAVGAAGTFAAIKPMVEPIKEAAKAQEAYNEQVKLYGRLSNQARLAKMKLDIAMKGAPAGTRDLLRERAGLSTDWAAATRPGQQALLGAGIFGLQRVRRFARGAGGAATNRVAGASAREGRRFTSFLTGRTGSRFARQGAGIYDENLGNLRGATEGGLTAFINVMQAARPFFRESTVWLREWTGGWAEGTRDITRTRERIREMVDHLRSWKNLTGATFRLLRDIFTAGAPSGRSMVDRLTQTFDRWGMWIRTHPAEVQDFFRRTVSSTIDLARALAAVTRALSQLATMLQPVLDRFGQLVTLAGKLGLLQPGALSLAYGAYRGVRGRGRGGGAGGPGGGVGGPLGGGGGRGGRPFLPAGLGGRFSAYREDRALRGVINSPMVLGRGERDAARRALRARQAARTPGYARGTYGLARSFGYGRLASAYAPVRGMVGSAMGRGAALGGRALGGALGTFGPMAALGGVLGAASTEGNLSMRAAGALSGATFGMLKAPETDTQIADRGFRGVPDRISENVAGIAGGRRTYGAEGRRVDYLRRVRSTYQGDNSEQAQKIVKALNSEIRARRGLRSELKQEQNARSRARGRTAFSELQEGFRNRRGRMGEQGAFGDTVSRTLGAMRHLRSSGARELGQATLDWAREAKRKNPALTKEYDRLVDGVRARFRRLNRNVQIVNGQILTGTRREWGNIKDAIVSAARRGVTETSAEFKRLRDMAVGQLMAMGFSRSESMQLFSATRSRGQAGRVANYYTGRAAAGDRQPVSGTALQGGGTERAAVGRGNPFGGPTPEDHRARLQAGQGYGPGMAQSSGLMGAKPGLGGYAGHASRFGLHVSSGLRPGSITSSGNVSLHSSGDAIDVSGPSGQMLAYARFMSRRYGAGLDELIHTPLGRGQIKNGQSHVYSGQVAADHFDHVHVGDRTPGGRAGGLGGGGPLGAAGPLGRVSLRGRRSRLGGVPRAMSTAASAGIARGMEAALNRRIGSAAPGLGGPVRGGQLDARGLSRLWVRAGGPQNIANLMGAIAMAESAGKQNARNPSGASGYWQILGQIVPGNIFDPMVNARNAVAKWKTQGLGAWEAYTKGMHTRFLGSFRRGGRFVTRPGRGGLFEAGEGPNREEVTVRPFQPRRRRGGSLLGGPRIHVEVSMGSVTVREDADIERLAERVGEKVGEKLLVALGDTNDKELMD